MDLLISADNPPTSLVQLSASKKSSTHNMDGVFMVAPENISRFNLPFFLSWNNFGIGQGGLYVLILSTAFGDRTRIP